MTHHKSIEAKKYPWEVEPARPKGTLVAGAILVVFLVVVYFVVPDELPWTAWLLAGFVNAVLAALVAIFAVVEYGRKIKAIKVPRIGEVDSGLVFGTLAFLAVMVWWFTPWAPILVAAPAEADIAAQLAAELEAIVLVLPREDMAAIQKPVPPQPAIAAAARIEDDADSYRLALKAIAESRFDAARQLLARAETEGQAEPLTLELAKAQIELFAGRGSTAWELYRSLAENHGDNLDVQFQTALAALHAGRTRQAAQFADRVLKQAESQFGEGQPEMVRVLNLLMVLKATEGDYEQAASYSDQAVAILEQTSGQQWDETGQGQLDPAQAGDPQLAAALNNRAVMYALRARYSGASALLRSWAIGSWRKIYGENDSHVAVSLANLAVVELIQARYREAHQLVDQSLEVRRRTLPPTHAGIGSGLGPLALIELRRARYDKAREHGEQALEILQRSLDQNDPNLLAVLCTMGEVFAAQARYEDADLRFGRVISDGHVSLSPAHPFLAITRNRQAEVAFDQGNVDQAESLSREALQACTARLGEDHPATATIKTTLARIYFEQDKRREARNLIEQAVETYRKAYGDNADKHPDFAAAKSVQAAMNDSLRTLAAGTSLYREAISIAESALGGEHPTVARYLSGMARLYAGQRDYASAEPLLKRALEIREKALPPDHPDIAVTLDELAVLMEKTKREEEAKRFKARAEEIRRQHAANREASEAS